MKNFKHIFKIQRSKLIFYQVTDLINFLKDDVAFGSIIIIAVRDSTKGNRFTENSVAYLEKLGAGIEGCPVKIGYLFWSFVKHMLK